MFYKLLVIHLFFLFVGSQCCLLQIMIMLTHYVAPIQKCLRNKMPVNVNILIDSTCWSDLGLVFFSAGFSCKLFY